MVKEVIDEQSFHCTRCEVSLSVAEAVALDGGSVLKILCPDCFEVIGAPEGYELLRDVSHLSGNSN